MLRVIIAIGFILLVGSVVYGLTGAVVLSGLWSSDHVFESARWKTAAGIDDIRNHPRAAMLVSLRTILRVGMSRAEVEALLGEPHNSRDGSRVYRYGVGASGMGIDYDEFVIEFDEAGKLVRHFIDQG